MFWSSIIEAILGQMTQIQNIFQHIVEKSFQNLLYFFFFFKIFGQGVFGIGQKPLKMTIFNFGHLK